MDTNRKKIRVVVCGTNFGRIYLKGIEQLKNCQLVGILSRGSQQSQECAKKYGVPLYHTVDELDVSMVDMVCVAIKSSVTGGAGTRIALQCLEKGINVLQEQPVHYDDVWKCYKTALSHHCFYSVNSFYSNIRAGRIFTSCAEKLREKTGLLCMEASCSIQVIYPLLDLMGKVFGSVSPLKIEKISQNNEVLTVLEGSICNIPLLLKVENRMVTEDADNYALLYHKINLFTESGLLTMDSSIGFVLWEPRYFIPHAEDGSLDLYGDNEDSKMPVTEILNPEDETNSYQDIYSSVWPEGIAKAIQDFSELIECGNIKQKMQYQLNLCKEWSRLGAVLGPIKTIEKTDFVRLRAKDIMEG